MVSLDTVRIRPAEPRDIDELAELAQETYVAAFGHSFAPGDLAAHLERHLSPTHVRTWIELDAVLLAEAGERLVGFVQLGPAGDAVELRRLYVAGDFQNRGIGGRLMQAALAHPAALAADRIVLDVWERNHAARRFYERFGFKVVGHRAFEVVSGAQTDPDLIMALKPARVPSPS
ncbi:MAG: GNAT family N-acetyltransferase [Caldilineales bacterium]